MTAADGPHLELVRPRPKPRPGRCEVGAQVVLSGPQETRVEAATALAGKRGSFIAVKIGSVVMLIEDTAALQSAMAAWRQAEELGVDVFDAEAGRK